MPLLYLPRQDPVIAAVKDNASLQLVIDPECRFIPVLYGNICTISSTVKKVKDAGEYAFIRVDLLEGASNREVVIQFLEPVTEAGGVISTKTSALKATRTEGFFRIHHLFIAGSISFRNIDKQVAQSDPNCIEILPGCMPEVPGWMTEKIRQPLTADGLVCDGEDVCSAINTGVVTLSATNVGVWTLVKKLLRRDNRNRLNLV